MANTRSASLSVRLKPETKKRLAKLAQASGRSSNFLISDAIESYVADPERLMADVAQANRQVKSGHYIRNEDVKACSSPGTELELRFRDASAANSMTARSCACRNCLVASGDLATAADSSLGSTGQAGSSRTSGYAKLLRL